MKPWLYSDMDSTMYCYCAEKYGIDPYWLRRYLYYRDDIFRVYDSSDEWHNLTPGFMKESDWLNQQKIKKQNEKVQKISRVGIKILQWMFFGPIIYIILATLCPALPMFSVVCFLLGLWDYADKSERQAAWGFAAILMVAFVITFPFWVFVIYPKSCKC